jgi:predicted Zn-dependent peptidase
MGLNTLVAGNSLVLGSVRALPGRDLDDVSGVAEEVVHAFAVSGPTEHELAMARAQAERDWLDEMATAAGRADALSGEALLFDDPALLNDRLPLLRSLTAEEVRQAAQTWLLPAFSAQVRVHATAGEGAA